MVRPLTPLEVRALPLALRCCYHLQPWTNTVAPTGVDDWARRTGWRAFAEGEDEPGEMERERAVTRAAFEAMRLHAFAKDVIDMHESGFW